MLASNRVHRARRMPRSVWCGTVLLFVTFLAACGSPPTPSGPATPITLTACGSSAPLATDSGPAPSAPASIYLGGVGTIGFIGGGGVKYSGTMFQRLYALAPTSGATRWCDQFNAPYTYHCPPGVDCAEPLTPVVGKPSLEDGVLYACVRNVSTEVVALDAVTGRPRWTHRTFCDVGNLRAWSGPLPHAGNLIFAGQDALDMATGRTVWSTTLPVQLQATDGTRVYGTYYSYIGGTRTTTTTLYALDARTGALIWQVATPLDIATIPAAQGGLLVAGEGGKLSDGAAFYGIDAATGAIRWHVPLAVTEGDSPGGSTPVLADGMVFTQAPDGLVTLDAATGTQRWRLPAAQYLSYLSPLVVGTTAYVGGSAGLWAVDVNSGHVKWKFDNVAVTVGQVTYSYSFSGSTLVSQPVLIHGVLVSGISGPEATQGLKAGVIGLDPASGKLLWSVGNGDDFAAPTAG